MGRNSFSGPVYGALQTLLHVTKDSVATAQTALEIFECAVPADEDWYIKRAYAYCEGAGSAAATIDVEDDTVSVLSADITLSAAAPVAGTLAGSASFVRVEAGSAITVDATTGSTTGPSDIQVVVEGWRRFTGAPLGRTAPLE